MKKILCFLFSLFIIVSCEKRKQESIELEQDIEISNDSLKEVEITTLDTIKSKIPKQLLSSIEKDYKDKQYIIIDFYLGLIDNNETEDAVVIIQEKDKSSEISESILVYQNISNSYVLMAHNRSLITEEYYFSSDEPTNGSKEIEIKDHYIKIRMFCYGPCGNTFLDFKFENDDILLINFSTYDIGAGSQIEQEYDVENDIVKIITTNTMTDDMEVTEEEFAFNYSKGKSIRFIDLNTKDLFKALINLESKNIL
ncbi:conserved hypothetical protein [Flavobacterium sp. 9AF]|uniref:hypothetical protein n=1 Tax=Flavobacterium sp. 9AF TaxID=2653142 RepID=UPI0012EFE212|nr:hypothetical protein [Flavobacterium sp. 9AF]VXB62087.1 conserved hypothetical protein [Flavobacterium sp. 9AF]